MRSLPRALLLALTVLVAAGPTGLAAQVGRVLDGASDAPIPGARLEWQTTDGAVVARALTDAQGRFTVPESWAGSGGLEVRALGYALFSVEGARARANGWIVRLEADPLDLDQVVVTVAGRAQRRSEVAVPVQRLDAQEIESSGAPSAVDLLEDIPGLQATSGTPTGSNIMIRGIGDSRVLILVDGQPVAGALMENRDLSRLSLAGVESVEVVKGPLSSLYGSDALGGVINVITADPETGFRLGGRFTAGENGRAEADLTASGGEAVRYRVTGAWRELDRVPGLADGLEAFSRVWDLRSTARWGDPGALQLRGDFSVLRERQKWPVGGGFNGFNDNVGLTGWVEASHPGAGGTFSLRAFGQDYSHLYRSSRTEAPIAGADDERQEESLWKATLAWSATLGGHGIDLGIEAATRGITSPDKLLEDRAEDTQFELFAQDAWRIGRTTLTAGVRGTFNDRWGNTASPTFGISSLISDDLRVRASAGRGFRSPSFKELAWDFANLGGGYTVQGFADLAPERSWNVSGGIEWAPTRRLRVGVEAFNNEIDDLIEFAFVGNSPAGLLIYSPRNVARARTRGVEATASAREGRWRIAADYAFLDTRSLEDDVPLDRRARHSGRLQIGTDVPVLEGLAIDLDGSWTGEAAIVGIDERGDPARVDTRAALFSLDANLALEFRPGLRLVVGGDNLLDRQPEGWQAVVGRRLRVGLEARDLF